MTYPYEYFIRSNLQEPIILTKEDFWSTLKQESTPGEEINRTQEIITKFNIKNGHDLTMFYLLMDVLMLGDVFENFVKTSNLMYGINPLYSYSAPGYA